jgi:hypothetical protein
MSLYGLILFLMSALGFIVYTATGTIETFHSVIVGLLAAIYCQIIKDGED